MDYQFIADTELFKGCTKQEAEEMLGCLGAQEKSFPKEYTIFHAGQAIHKMGLLLSGGIHIVRTDVWGNQNIIGNIMPGEVFAETYACISEEPMFADVIAVRPSEVLFLDVWKVMSTCVSSCRHHQRLIRNLVTIMASKNLNLAQKINHITPKTIDPVMGDNGNVYAMFTDRLLSLMKELVWKADAITPNLTELCLLTDTDYRMIQNMTDERNLLTIVEQMARNVIKKGPDTVVVTGIHFLDGEDGVEKMGNLAVSGKQVSLSAFPYVGGSYSGTGDLFASVIAAGIARGDKITESIRLAGGFIERAIVDSVKENIPRNDGVNYEQFLGMLMKNTNK